MGIGFCCVAGAATLLGILPTIQKQLMMNGLPLSGLMFYTNLTITVFCLVMALVKKSSFKATKVQVAQALLMGVFGMLLTAVLLNTSYMYLPVGTTIMLNFLYPTIVCVIMGTVFKAGFSKLQILAICASVLGMVFLTGGGGELSATGALCAPPGGLMGWILAIGGSGMFTVGGYFLMMYGISRMGASTASFVSMLEPVVSVVFGTIWFKDPVTVGIVAGGILIISGILFITIDGYQKAKMES